MDARLLKASWFVENAFAGVEQPHPDASSPRAVQCFKLYHRFHYVRRLTVLVLLATAYVEVPFWCHNGDCGDPKDPMTPLTFDVVILSRRNSRIVTLCCLGIIILNDILLIMALKRQFIRRKDRRAVFLFSILAVLNVAIVERFDEAVAVKIGVFLRMIIFCLSYKSVRGIYVKMYKILARVQHIVSLIAIHVCFFGWLSTILFENTPEGAIMSSFVESSWQLLIVLTTANFPDVMMPAYTDARWQSAYFILYILFGLYFCLNLILAQIFSNFQDLKSVTAEKRNHHRVRMLQEAFDLLCSIPKSGLAETPRSEQGEQDNESPSEGELWIEESLCIQLLEELNYYRSSPYVYHDRCLYIAAELDPIGYGRVYCDDFLRICDIIYRDEQELKPSEIQRFFPRIANSRAYLACCYVVEHPRFDKLVDAMLIVNAIVIIVEFSVPKDTRSREVWTRWNLVDILFSSIFLLEMIAKILVKGTSAYWFNIRNRFDSFITITTSFIDFYAYIPNSMSDTALPKALLAARCLRMLRLIMFFEPYRVIFFAFLRILPREKNILLVLFCNMNFFAALGYAIFGGRISPGLMQASYPTSPYTTGNYGPNNFNDIPSGMVTLFELLMVNNWFVIVDGHVMVTSKYSRFFFIAFWLIGVLVTLNLFIASLMDTFRSEVVQKKQPLTRLRSTMTL